MATPLKRRIERDLFFLGGLAVGARLMYMLDPDRGRRRRALARDRASWLLHQAQHTLDRSVRDLANRVKGVAAEVISDLVPEDVDDVVLVDRVRARLGRAVSHPGAIHVYARDGVITLEGAVLQEEVQELILAVRSVRGVKAVVNKATPYLDAEDVPELQGDGHLVGPPFELLRENWKPATRMLVGTAGLGLAAYGFLYRRDIPGALLGVLGAGAMVRSAVNERIFPLPGVRDRHHGIELQKTLHFRVPTEKVYEMLADPTKFPLFFSHVHAVEQTGDKRHHWTISGPLSTCLKWETEITRVIPDRLIAWRSTPGASIENTGVVQFTTDDQGTRVHIRLTYFPPAGILTHRIVELFGADPKAVLDQDLARLKSLLEQGKTHVHQHKVTLSEVAG